MIKRTFILIFLACSLYVCASCQARENKHRTEIFSRYLQQTFQEKLSEGKAIYFVITSDGCPACKTSLLAYLQTQTADLKLIVAQDWEVELPETVEILYDKDASINRLNMKTSGTYALFVQNQSIVRTFSITPPDLSSFGEDMEDFFNEP